MTHHYEEHRNPEEVGLDPETESKNPLLWPSEEHHWWWMFYQRTHRHKQRVVLVHRAGEFIQTWGDDRNCYSKSAVRGMNALFLPCPVGPPDPREFLA